MKSAWLRGLPLLVLLIGAVWAGPAAPTEGGPLLGAKVYRRTLRGVAWVHSPDAGKGTGWLLDRSRRLLVTCATSSAITRPWMSSFLSATTAPLWPTAATTTNT